MSKAPKKLFVVRGSEDGNLGVYSNVKRALDRAEEYLKSSEGGMFINFPPKSHGEFCVKREATYANVCIRLNSVDYVEIELNSSSTTCSIQKFFLNQ